MRFRSRSAWGGWLALGLLLMGQPLNARTPGHRTKEDDTMETAHAQGPAPRFDSWQILGPGGGGTMIAPTISPHDPKIVVEHCDMTGAYITLDGGRSWRMFNLRSVLACHAFDPLDPKVIYGGNAGVWRSEDTGRSWSLIFPDPAKNTRGHHRGDHGDYSLSTDDPQFPPGNPQVEAIAVDPADSRSLYVVFGATGGRPSALYHSGDYGATWTRAKEFEDGRILALHLHKGQPGAQPDVYAVFSNAVQRRIGGAWERLATPVAFRTAAAGDVREGGEPRLYATGLASWQGETLEGGVYVSGDGGRSWKPALHALSGLEAPERQAAPFFGAIACAARNATAAYVGFAVRTDRGRSYGIARTTDGGQRWSVVHRDAGRPYERHEISWLEPRMPEGHSVYFVSAWSLGVAPSNGDICYVTDLFRTFCTSDGGKSWKTLNSIRKGAGWTTTGLDVTTCYGLHFDPHDPKRRYITYTDIGLCRSEDGGQSWINAVEGVPGPWKNTTYWIALDPAIKDLLWGAFAFNHDLPRPKMWRRTDPDDYRGGVCVSTDGGKTWTPSNAGMPETAVTHVLLDPTSPSGNRTLYACGFGKGVFKSTDNGKTWALKNAGITQRQPFAWRIVRADDGALYLIISRRSENGEIGNEEDGALYRSTDGAEHWEKMALPAGCNGPSGLAIDPARPARMYLAAWGVKTPGGDTGGGVFLTEDGGKSWTNIFHERQHVYDVTVDPKHPDTLYLCGFDASAYRSTDAGKTWQRLRGYNFHWGHRVVLDPEDATKIYITTYGGSLWHGPAVGDPDALEDIRTPIPVAQ